MNKGFTLAEVLITIGVIGIVAAMTMPVLVGNYQKKQNIVTLKKAYAEMSQALTLAQIDNGMMEDWDLKDFESPQERISFFCKNYIYPYVSVVKICEPTSQYCFVEEVKGLNGSNVTLNSQGYVSFITKSGYSVLFWIHGDGTGGHFIIDTNGPYKQPNTYGKDIFRFLVTFKASSDTYVDTREYNRGLRAYGLINGVTRDDLLGNGDNPSLSNTDGCDKSKKGEYCAALLIFDNWEIKNDYPW